MARIDVAQALAGELPVRVGRGEVGAQLAQVIRALLPRALQLRELRGHHPVLLAVGEHRQLERHLEHEHVGAAAAAREVAELHRAVGFGGFARERHVRLGDALRAQLHVVQRMMLERFAERGERRGRRERRQFGGQLPRGGLRHPARQRGARAPRLRDELEAPVVGLAEHLPRGEHLRLRAFAGRERNARELDRALEFLRERDQHPLGADRLPRVEPGLADIAGDSLAQADRLGARLPGFGERALGPQPALVAAGNGLLPAHADLGHVVARARENCASES